MITVKGADDVGREIDAMKDAVGAANDAQLAEFIGVSRTAVSLWRKRNSIPESARRRVASLSRYGQAARAMDERRIELGHQVMYEGRCLAIWLAPSHDAAKSGRISPMHYSERMRHFASLFSEIELACAEEVAKRLGSIDGNAADAMASLTGDPVDDLYQRVLQRAMEWRG